MPPRRGGQRKGGTWTRARQIASERPPDPLVSGCAACGKQRTCIRVNGELHCLRCLGCPWCGQRRWTEEVVDPELVTDPVVLQLGNRQQHIRGDWVCGYGCGRTLTDWSTWRRRMRAWMRGTEARAGGYKRTEDKAA